MGQFLTATILSLCALVISIATFLLSYRMRKKDFQLALMKEQLAAGQKTIDLLLNVHEGLIRQYKLEISPIILHKGLDAIDGETIKQCQTALFIKLQGLFYDNFRAFQLQYSILPESVLHAALDYFVFVSDLFENHNDFELGTKLHQESWFYILDTMEAIRMEAGVNHLSEETRKLFYETGKVDNLQ